MYKIWLLFDPRKILVLAAIGLFTLALIIHFILLDSDRYSWIEGTAEATMTTQELMSSPYEVS